MDRKETEIAVVGAGAAGLVSAIALAREGFDTVVVGAPGARRDGRTVALLDGSVQFLTAIGAWDAIADAAAPLAAMRIVDDTGSLFRAPPLTFQASEIGLDAFGFNIEAATLVERLAARAQATDGLTMLGSAARSIATGADAATIQLADGRFVAAKVVVGADGRQSLARQAAGIATRSWAYPQSALTAILSHARDHDDISTEFHTRAGPFTLVPLPGRRSSLVWVCRPAEAERLMALDDAALGLAIERQAHSVLGRMTLDGPRGCVPMAGLSVSRFTARRLALIGDAAHVFPPIGAQGLNLGMRDAAALRDALVDANAAGPFDADEALAAYERGRGLDVRLRTGMVDALNRTLLADFLPLDLMRGAGMLALGLFRPLRRAAMREGLAPRYATPRLMRRSETAAERERPDLDSPLRSGRGCRERVPAQATGLLGNNAACTLTQIAST